jgi:hypothetical protein
MPLRSEPPRELSAGKRVYRPSILLLAPIAGKKPARAAAELTSLQRELAPAPPAGGNRPGRPA